MNENKQPKSENKFSKISEQIVESGNNQKTKFSRKSNKGEAQSLDAAEGAVGGVPGGASPCISVAIEGSTCAPGTGGVADATVDTAVDDCAAEATSGVVAETLFVIV